MTADTRSRARSHRANSANAWPLVGGFRRVRPSLIPYRAFRLISCPGPSSAPRALSGSSGTSLAADRLPWRPWLQPAKPAEVWSSTPNFNLCQPLPTLHLFSYTKDSNTGSTCSIFFGSTSSSPPPRAVPKEAPRGRTMWAFTSSSTAAPSTEPSPEAAPPATAPDTVPEPEEHPNDGSKLRTFIGILRK